MAQRRGPPKVFLSYAHETREHQDSVLDLATRLRRQGIDVSIDQFEESPAEGWPSWIERQIRESDFVLSVCTPLYLRRFLRQTAPHDGRGVRWEGRLIFQHIYSAGSETRKFIPILIKGGRFEDIPKPLQGATFYSVDSETGFTGLLRRLKGKRRVALATPVRERVQDFLPWNVPLPRNRWFTGRNEVLQGLRDALCAGDWIQGISGLGGIGKTQTAVEYAYRFRDRYDAVFWASAETEAQLSASFSEIARLLESGDTGEEREDLRGFVLRSLEESTNWLFIFDNADEPELLSRCLPQRASGHVLITSRAQALHHARIAKPVALDRLSESDAVGFLFERTGREAAGEEKTAAAALAHELGFLPLALEQAAAYIVEKESRFRDYLATFKKRTVKLLEKQKPVAGAYHSSVAGTWSLNFQQVEKDPAAADLLRFSAFLSPDAIPLELLTAGAPILGPNLAAALSDAGEDPLAVDEVLSTLTRYSLVRRNAEAAAFSVHRLVQEMVRSALEDAAREIWVERTIGALRKAIPETFPVEKWPLAERLMPHVFACEKMAQASERPVWEAGNLFHLAGWYSAEIAQYDQAERLYRTALSVWERFGEKGELALAGTLQNLGALCFEESRYAEAEDMILRAQALWEQRGGDPLRLAQMLTTLVSVYLECKRGEEAELPLKRIMEIYGASLPANDPAMACAQTQFARLHRLRGRNAEAQSLCEGVIQLDPNNSDALGMLAEIYKETGRSDDAEAMVQRNVDLLAARIASLSASSIEAAGRRLTMVSRKWKATPS